MDVYYSKRQLEHRPQQIMLLGKLTPPVENPDRLEVLARRLTIAGLKEVTPADHGRDAIEAVHSADYIDFLASSYARWAAIPRAGPEVLPNTHPYRGKGSALGSSTKPPCSVVNAQAGWYIGDLNCAIGAGTWNAVYQSAQAALSAAHAMIDGAPSAFALCRPPGHHAFADVAGGFCFINNSAVAAQVLRRQAARVAILDVDLHHGNGTQGIFYARPDVLTVSLHADPVRFYPFFWGHADERGEGPGLGYNLNLPLPRKSGDAAFLEALAAAFQRIRAFAPEALVVALGLDAFEGDPFGGLSVTTPGFSRIGEAIAGLGLPTVIVQEGGYLCDALGDNLTAFLTGFGGKKD